MLDTVARSRWSSAQITGSADADQSFNGWFARDRPRDDRARDLDARRLHGRGTDYVVQLLEYPPLGGSPGESSSELIRLSPPEGQVGPVIQLVLSGALTFDTTEATIPSLAQLPAPVRIESWLWQKATLERDGVEEPTAATVTLTATRLEGIEQGIFASYSTTADVAEDGKLSALVLPGTYRARVVPRSAPDSQRPRSRSTFRAPVPSPIPRVATRRPSLTSRPGARCSSPMP